MDDFQKFLSLSNTQRNRIVKVARTVQNMTAGQLSFEMIVSVMTGVEYAKNENIKQERSRQVKVR
jgi:hypothetical protein